MNGRADTWLRGTGIMLKTPLPSRYTFCSMVRDRFAEISSFDAMKQFQGIQQLSTISQYIDNFEEAMVLMKRDNPYIQEPFFTAAFIRGLKLEIKQFVKCHKPSSLLEAYWYARHLENTGPPRKTQLSLPAPRNSSFGRNSSWRDARPKTPNNTLEGNKEPKKRYFCKEARFYGHKCKYGKSIHAIVVDSDQGEGDTSADYRWFSNKIS
uniref:Retrotransposon gag domain-containing protein n=1 Tax=Arundo donax TaxID=35708 RepID=A0A0A9C849_ARUDO